jgi:hypothetical protein
MSSVRLPWLALHPPDVERLFWSSHGHSKLVRQDAAACLLVVLLHVSLLLKPITGFHVAVRLSRLLLYAAQLYMLRRYPAAYSSSRTLVVMASAVSVSLSILTVRLYCSRDPGLFATVREELFLDQGAAPALREVLYTTGG